MGAQIILGNTFHLWMRPGLDVLRQFGGLHRFEGWTRPMLTDSGGFQVWSLGGRMRKISEEGVRFASPVNGDKLFLTPEVSMQIQTVLNSRHRDAVRRMHALRDPGRADHRSARRAQSMELSLRWARRSQAEFARLGNPNALFGIVQGGMFEPCAKPRWPRWPSWTCPAMRSAASASASPRTRCCASWRTRRTGCRRTSRAT
jgi:queuine tRNA-ribosyltransferase